MLTRLALAVLCCTAAAQAQDTVLVGDFNGSRVMRYNYPSGSPLSHFVGTGMTGANGVAGLTFGPDAFLYIASYNNNSVFKVDRVTGEPAGTFIASGIGGLLQPVGIAFGPDGRFYVASFGNDSVNVYNGSTGAFVTAFVPAGTGGLDGPYGIAFYNGDLYVCSYNNDKVIRYNGTTGAYIEDAITAGQATLNGPKGVCFDQGGRMYVSSDLNSAILVKDPVAGVSVLTSFATNNQINRPALLTLTGPTGDLLIPSYGNGTVQRINRTSGVSLGALVTNGSGGSSSSLTVLYMPSTVPCYANCDNSVITPVLNVQDFVCFINKFSAGCP